MIAMRSYPAPAFEFKIAAPRESDTLDVYDTSEAFEKYYEMMIRPDLWLCHSISKRDASRHRKTSTTALGAKIKDDERPPSSERLMMYAGCLLRRMLNPRDEGVVHVEKNLAMLRSLKQGEPIVHGPEERALRSWLTLSLLEFAPNISSVHLPVSALIDQKEYYERFTQLLESGLPQLKDLTLTSPRDQERAMLFQKFLRILKACCQKPLMTELNCGFSVTYSSRADTTAVNQTLRCLASSNSHLKKLRLPRSSKKGLPTTFLIPFLRTCVPHLETLTVPHVAERDWHKLEATLKDHCPSLNHLRIDFLDSQYPASQLDEFYAGIIPFRHGFKGITLENNNTQLYKIPEALLQHHSQTLQHVEFSSRAVVSSKEIQQILSSCTALKSFIASESTSSFLKLSDALESDWACLGLEKLHLRLQSDRACLRRTLELGLDQDLELNPKQLKYIKGDKGAGYLAVRKLYRQIGKLMSLEELYLVQWGGFSNIHVMDWTLSEGLPYLRGLQKMRCLVMNYGYGKVERADVEFMAENWPLLKRVKFMFLKGMMLRIVGESAHWMWLKERRPSLDFCWRNSDE
ncbi:hypothetical protein EC968_005015 [Mortierella alpina]|nr:hypothetical protein EC968_005015 [Mortierella alpina]